MSHPHLSQVYTSARVGNSLAGSFMRSRAFKFKLIMTSLFPVTSEVQKYQAVQAPSHSPPVKVVLLYKPSVVVRTSPGIFFQKRDLTAAFPQSAAALQCA